VRGIVFEKLSHGLRELFIVLVGILTDFECLRRGAALKAAKVCPDILPWEQKPTDIIALEWGDESIFDIPVPIFRDTVLASVLRWTRGPC
jgi:hypothetical protein